MNAGEESNLEDTWLDIVEKARTGLGMDQRDLCATAGIAMHQWLTVLRTERPNPELMHRIALALGLNPRSLTAIAEGRYVPNVTPPDGMLTIRTPFPMPGFPDATVNAYLIRIPGSSDAVLFDAGTAPEIFLAHVQALHLNIVRIYITHSHHDHIGALPSLHAAYPDAPVYSHSCERAFPFMNEVTDGTLHTVGSLKIRSIHTPGHSNGGMTYFAEGLDLPTAFVGDALFAGSAGRIPYGWDAALKTIRTKILTLPPHTILCPGHGPATSIAAETANNPFFAS